MNLITDRTASDVEYAKAHKGDYEDLKGSYNASDLNRVESAVQELQEKLKEVGIVHNLTVKTDWTLSDYPTESDMIRYLSNVALIRASYVLPGITPNVPDNMRYLTYDEANDIETILLTIEDAIEKVKASQFYSGELESGEI